MTSVTAVPGVDLQNLARRDDFPLGRLDDDQRMPQLDPLKK
ncbi:hypothetical protein [Kocuria sp.]|nr:hypothetical protein [Kocuria sp.]MDO5368320.1 hypothetical protein [Kocuria sp.]